MQLSSLEAVVSLDEWRERAQVGAVLLVTSLACVPLTTLAVQRIFPGRNVIFARWGFSHVLAVVAFVALSFAVIGALFRFEDPTSVSLVTELAISAAVLAGACGLVAYFAVRLEPDGIAALGIRQGRQARAAFAGFAAYFMSIPGLFGLMLLWPWILTEVGVGYEVQAIAQRFQSVPKDEIWIAVTFGVAVLPLFEEILFRAFLQPLLVQNFSEKGGIVLTSILFAALHGTHAFLPIFGLSLVLCSVMQRTQRLSSVWLIHAIHNGLTTLALFAAPDPVPGILPM